MREHLNPWSRILNEAQERHEVQLDALVDEYKRNGDSENVAHLKAQNTLLPLYRKELKELLEYIVYSDDERLHLPKSDGNPKRSQRYRWI